MTTKGYYLSEEDLSALREIYSWIKGRPTDKGRADPPRQIAVTPDVHVAKAPVGGIPATVGTVPGSAVCDVYLIDPAGPSFKKWAETGLRVYNITTSRIPGEAWIAVHRSKKGEWITDTLSFDDEYYYNTSYGDIDDRGSIISHVAVINIGCDNVEASPTYGSLIGDVVEYTVTGLIRGNRLSLAISTTILEEDKVLLATTCEEVLVDVSVTVATTSVCVDGDIVSTSTPTVTKTFETFRVVACGSCE